MEVQNICRAERKFVGVSCPVLDDWMKKNSEVNSAGTYVPSLNMFILFSTESL